MVFIKIRNISKTCVFLLVLTLQILSTLCQSHYDGNKKYTDSITSVSQVKKLSQEHNHNYQTNDKLEESSGDELLQPSRLGIPEHISFSDTKNTHFTPTQKTYSTSIGPRFTPKRTHRKRLQPHQNGPLRRESTPEAKVETPLSPIQTSLGGLTGLQGLPPLSLIQFIKLLVALTPFLLPIVFVPLLIFTIGMFMIPVTKSKIFIGGDAGIRASSQVPQSWTSWGYSLVPTLNDFARRIANHEDCLDRLVCEIGRRYLPEGRSLGKEFNQSFDAVFNRPTIQRILNYFNHPLSRKISRSLQIPTNTCGNLTCRPASFLQKFVHHE